MAELGALTQMNFLASGGCNMTMLGLGVLENSDSQLPGIQRKSRGSHVSPLTCLHCPPPGRAQHHKQKRFLLFRTEKAKWLLTSRDARFISY